MPVGERRFPPNCNASAVTTPIVTKAPRAKAQRRNLFCCCIDKSKVLFPYMVGRHVQESERRTVNFSCDRPSLSYSPVGPGVNSMQIALHAGMKKTEQLEKYVA